MSEISEIKATSLKIHNLSKDYFLSHTVDACEKYILEEIKLLHINQIENLKSKARKAEDDKEVKNIKFKLDEITKKIKEQRFHIFIDYADISEDKARTIHINGNLEIVLPISLLKDKTKKNITQIRKLLAHELGHIILHTKEIVSEYNLRGSLDIQNKQKEKEADEFADEIIKLKSELYQKLCKDEIMI